MRNLSAMSKRSERRDRDAAESGDRYRGSNLENSEKGKREGVMVGVLEKKRGGWTYKRRNRWG